MAETDFFVSQIDHIGSARIVVTKSRRLLEVFDDQSTVARMHAALGRAGGPKLAQGDGRTPEGLYYTCVKNDKSKYHLSIGLSYPNLQDAARGLEAGIIKQGDYDSIADAISQGKRPPWDTALGGEIMIHGGGSDRDWTAGCIALDDDCMDFLFQWIENGTVVEIIP